MKAMTLLTVLFAGAQAHATLTLNCFGTTEYKGSRATVVFNDDGAAVLQGQLVHDTWKSPVRCGLKFDSLYRPRTAKPKYNKYYVDGKFCGDWASVSKSIATEGQGYINLVQENCGHPGDACETGFFCRAAR